MMRTLTGLSSRLQESPAIVSLRDLLVFLEFAPSVAFADKLIDEGRVRLRGQVVTSGSMMVSADEEDIILGPKHSHNASQTGNTGAHAKINSRSNAAKSVVDNGLAHTNLTPKTFPEDVSFEKYLEKEFGLIDEAASRVIQSRMFLFNEIPLNSPKSIIRFPEHYPISISSDVSAVALISILTGQSAEQVNDLFKAGRVFDKNGPLSSRDSVSLETIRNLRILSISNARLLRPGIRNTRRSDEVSLDPDLREVPNVTLADILFEQGFANSPAHAIYLCQSDHVTLNGRVVRNPFQVIRQTPRELLVLPGHPESLSEEEKLMKNFVDDLHAFVGPAGLRHCSIGSLRARAKQSGVKDSFMSTALAEFGGPHYLGFSYKIGAPCNLSLPRQRKNSVDSITSEGEGSVNALNESASKKDDESTAVALEEALRGMTVEDVGEVQGHPVVQESSDEYKNIEKLLGLGADNEADNEEAVAVTTEEPEVSTQPVEMETTTETTPEPVSLPTAPLKQALVELKLAADEEDAESLILARFVLVDGKPATSASDSVIVNASSVSVDNDILTMRRVIPRALSKSLDVINWPNPEQGELLWALAAISCFVCNVALEAFVCGVRTNASDAVSLFLKGGTVFEASASTAAVLGGSSRIMIERACNDAWTRWNAFPESGYPYRRKSRRAKEFFIDPQSEYFWPLVGLYNEEAKVKSFLDSFFLGEVDPNKRKRRLAVILDFVLYVPDDSFLLSESNRDMSPEAHKDRVKLLSGCKGFVDAPWSSGLKSLVA